MILLTIFRNGGFPMFFVVGFGAASVGTAFWYALHPDAKHEGFIKWMNRATLYAVLNGFCCDLATVAMYLSSADFQADSNQRIRILLEGFYESMSPGILGFAFLSLASFLTAVGRRRLDNIRGA